MVLLVVNQSAWTLDQWGPLLIFISIYYTEMQASLINKLFVNMYIVLYYNGEGFVIYIYALLCLHIYTSLTIIYIAAATLKMYM